MKKKILSICTILSLFTLMLEAADVSSRVTLVPETQAVPVFAGASAYSSFNMDMLSLSVDEEDTVATAAAVEEDICGYKNIGICVVDEGNVNVRDGADLNATVVGKLPQNAACEVYETQGEWTHISSGKIEGYVKSEFLMTGDAAKQKAKEMAVLSAVSKTGFLRVRKGPGTDYDILDQLMEGESLAALDVHDDWVMVNLDGTNGYVSSEYVDVKLTLPTAMTLAQARYGAEISEVRVQLCEFALKYVGRPYVWGGESLTNGVDCSGFVMKVYQQYGIYLPHYSGAQANYGKRISANEIQPGDLLFYSSGGAINHVAIYIGGGQIVHASNPRDGIKISPAFYRMPTACTRLLQ